MCVCVCNKAARLFYIKGGRVDIFIATLKNGCRHTMEGSTMPPQGPPEDEDDYCCSFAPPYCLCFLWHALNGVAPAVKRRAK